MCLEIYWEPLSRFPYLAEASVPGGLAALAVSLVYIGKHWLRLIHSLDLIWLLKQSFLINICMREVGVVAENAAGVQSQDLSLARKFPSLVRFPTNISSLFLLDFRFTFFLFYREAISSPEANERPRLVFRRLSGRSGERALFSLSLSLSYPFDT